MKKSLIYTLHIGFWLCYLMLAMVIIGVVYGPRGDVPDEKIERIFVTIICFAIIPSAVAFYSFYKFIFPRFIQKKNHFVSALMGLSFSILGGLVGYTLLYNMYGDNCLSGAENTESDLISMTLFIAFIGFISGVIALVIKGFITWVEEIKLKEELKQKTHEMELALVKAQLDPHFLFNTINNIDVLIIKDAEQASTYLNKLSDMMRFMLYETKSDSISLAQEIEYIEKYIELQKIRTSNDTYIKYTKSGEAREQLIAPMIFAPFIENAFKHTNNKKIADAISIQLKIQANKVEFECINKFDPDRKLKQENNGLGNELIQKRLNLLYPDKHSLQIKKEHATYAVYLSIEL